MNVLLTDHKVYTRPGTLRIIFLHHSTGRNLIRQGGIRDLIEQQNQLNGTSHEFWDHDYNEIGLTGPTGEKTGVSFNIPDDNTDPDGLERLFSQPIHDPPNNALSHLLSFDVIIFKSCFPVSAIRSRAMLEQYKEQYLSIRDTLARLPRKLFIVMTPPPLVPRSIKQTVIPRAPLATNPEDAKRAREFSLWLASEEFLMGLPNVATFDLFNLLAEPANSRRDPNTLRAEYRSGRLLLDSHPNRLSNETIAPAFVDALWQSMRSFQQHIMSDVLASSE